MKLSALTVPLPAITMLLIASATAQITVVPSSGSAPVKAVVCLTAGNISVIPTTNADNAPVAFVGVNAGFVPPFQVRRVMATGTTCTVMTVEG